MPTERLTTALQGEHIVDHRLILRGADGYDEARFARVFNLGVPSATRLRSWSPNRRMMLSKAFD